jgi:hypothetical protein
MPGRKLTGAGQFPNRYFKEMPMSQVDPVVIAYRTDSNSEEVHLVVHAWSSNITDRLARTGFHEAANSLTLEVKYRWVGATDDLGDTLFGATVSSPEVYHDCVKSHMQFVEVRINGQPIRREIGIKAKLLPG